MSLAINRRNLLALCGAGLCRWPGEEANAANGISIQREGDILTIRAHLPSSITEVELRIESDRNAQISKITDVSPLNPERRKAVSDPPLDADVWYPIVDVRLEPGMEGIAEMGAAPRACAINYNFHKKLLPLGAEAVIPANHLELWENAVYLEPASAKIGRFYLRQRLPVIDGEFRHQLTLLSKAWGGKISLYATDRETGSEFATAKVSADVPRPSLPPPGSPLSKQRLVWSLGATVAYLLRAQNGNPSSPTYQGLHLFYDLDAATYRSSYWIWGSGPAVKALLGADKVTEVSGRYRTGRLTSIADQIGRSSLALRITDPNQLMHGVPISRWARELQYKYGFDQCISVADGNFLSGWAWVPLYRATGNKAYLDAATDLALATERLMNEYGLIPQDYYEDRKQFSLHTIDESGFGVEGLAEIYAATGDPHYRKIAKDYIDQHLHKFQRKDGLWERGWNKNTGIMPAIFMTRGIGWAMEGLLAANRAVPDGGYLDLAKQMAEHLIEWQAPSGYWAFISNRQASEVGVSEKGTALWSYLFYQLYRATGDPRHLEVARKALTWCIQNQYIGPDPQAHGGLVGVSPHSAVGYRAWYRVCCAYTSGFFGLAALEELNLATA